MSKITLHADPHCPACKGSGMTGGDWVDYGSTRCQLPEDEPCECIYEQLPEDFDDWENVEIVEAAGYGGNAPEYFILDDGTQVKAE